MGNESGVPSRSTDCVGRPIVHLTSDTNSCVNKDEHSAIAVEQEDNGRSGGFSDMDHSAEHVKGNTIINTYMRDILCPSLQYSVIPICSDAR